VSLLGRDGLLQQLTERFLEAALEAEMDEHLGYGKHQAAGRNGANFCNCERGKTLLTEVGPVGIEVPRDRDGSFAPQVVAKRQRTFGGIDDLVISLTAKGLTTGEVAAHPAHLRRPSRSPATGVRTSSGCGPATAARAPSTGCATLLDWYRDGGDVPARLPVLSTYLGHVARPTPTGTCRPHPTGTCRQHPNSSPKPAIGWNSTWQARRDRARADAAGVLHRTTHPAAACQPHTIAAYRNALRLLLVFAATRTNKEVCRLDIADLDAPLVAGTLRHTTALHLLQAGVELNVIKSWARTRHHHHNEPVHRDQYGDETQGDRTLPASRYGSRRRKPLAHQQGHRPVARRPLSAEK
jgi:hypothetical protein